MLVFFTMLAYLLAAHALCDYPLQGDFLAKAKNWMHPIPGVPWEYALAAHAGIHAGAVLLITGHLSLAMWEFLAHFAIDFAKCGDLISFRADQLAHVACKVAWTYYAVCLSMR